MASSTALFKRLRFADMITSAGATRKARGWSVGGSGVEHYVGLEHLDSNSLRIRRWTSPDTVGENSDLRHFDPGDVILARRGIEQRKVGVAKFCGIASGHALVFRARPEVMFPGFLPHFLLSDLFMERALQFSAGSLSKTVNLSALMKQEFTLPALDQQRRLTLLFASINQVQDCTEDALEAGRLAAAAAADSIYNNFQGSYRPLGEQASVHYGLTVNAERRSSLERLPYIRVANVHRGRLDLSEIKEIGTLAGDERFLLMDGDILVVEGHADGGEVGRAAVWRDREMKCLHQNHIIRARVDREAAFPDFLVRYINSSLGRSYMRQHAKSTSGLSTLNSTVVRQMPIPSVPIVKQRQIVDTLDQIAQALVELEARAKDVARQYQQALNQLIQIAGESR